MLFLAFVLFRPCSSFLFLFSTYVVLLAAFLIFMHYILQNSAFVLSFWFLFFVFGLGGLFCCVLVPGRLEFHLPYLDYLGLFWFFSVSQSATT